MVSRPIILILSLMVAISNFLVFSSNWKQKILLQDASNGEFSLPKEEINQINHNYPNLSLNSVPILTYLSRYHSNNNDFELAIENLINSINKNPFNPYTKYLLSRNYILNNDLQLAESILHDTFIDFPKLDLSTILFISVLGENNNIEKLKDIYKDILANDNKEVWNYYLSSLKRSIKDDSDRLHLDKALAYFYKNF